MWQICTGTTWDALLTISFRKGKQINVDGHFGCVFFFRFLFFASDCCFCFAWKLAFLCIMLYGMMVLTTFSGLCFHFISLFNSHVFLLLQWVVCWMCFLAGVFWILVLFASSLMLCNFLVSGATFSFY